MSAPGFTAAASLYKTNEHYQMARVIAALKSEGAVVPQGVRGTAPIICCRCPCCLLVGTTLRCC
jgi:hypothetical protein